MSESEDNRPLSRRERRIREFGETGALPLLNPDGTSALTNPPAAEEEIFVDPLDENGNPRSRRQIREIRERIREERAAAQVRESERARAEGEVQAAAQVAADAKEAEARAQAAADAKAAAEAAAKVSSEAASDSRDEAANAAPQTEPESQKSESETAAHSDEDPRLAETQALSFDELLSLSNDDTEATQNETHTPLTPEVVVNDADGPEPSPEVETHDAPGLVAADADDDTDTNEVQVVSTVHDGPAEKEQPVSAKRSTYTFPDIAPLDDEVSVFDDPTVRTVRAAGKEAPGFDDLISRAVAQEGSAGATNTSALILPAMPEGTDLTGPLGQTGELFITGSIDLPRSFSETGGHASLIDSVDADHLDEFGAADQHPRESGIAPVSAARAVSARVIPGPVVTEAQKEKSKLPVVMIATGGGLVVVVAGLLIWGATSGMFG